LKSDLKPFFPNPINHSSHNLHKVFTFASNHKQLAINPLKEKSVYFKNLDGLRFFAAFAVICGHCQALLYGEKGGIDPYSPWASKLADFGVDFFFVLSGFLITYLTISEIEKTGKIDIKKFYLRRVLRIFPLYFGFGIVALTFGKFFLDWVGLFKSGFSFTQQPYTLKDYFTNLGFLFTFSINIQAMVGWHGGVSSMMVGHFWSLAVEEQFYLIWAPVLFFLRKRAWVAIILFTLLGLYFCYIPVSKVSQFTEFHINFTINKFFQFGIGGILSLLIFYKIDTRIFEQFMTLFTEGLFRFTGFLGKKTQAAVGIITPVLGVFFVGFILFLQYLILKKAGSYLFGNVFPVKQNEHIYNVYVSVGMIWVAIFQHSLLDYFLLETKVLKYLGRISFGIYVFHLIGIRLSNKLLETLQVDLKSSTFYLLLPLFATIFATIFAALSYKYFESYFLKMKHKFDAYKKT
jgi:peptidoglycan/LPS O-acetylase OafA/YrhL